MKDPPGNAPAKPDRYLAALFLGLGLFYFLSYLMRYRSEHRSDGPVKGTFLALYPALVFYGAYLLYRNTPGAGVTPLRGTGGAALLALGSFLTLKSRLDLGASWSVDFGRPRLETPHRLIRRGIYRQLRHPLYSGLFLLMAALFTLRPHPMTGAPLLLGAPLMRWAAGREEKALRTRYPAAYDDYAATVPAFVPRSLLAQ